MDLLRPNGLRGSFLFLQADLLRPNGLRGFNAECGMRNAELSLLSLNIPLKRNLLPFFRYKLENAEIIPNSEFRIKERLRTNPFVKNKMNVYGKKKRMPERHAPKRPAGREM